MFSPLIFHNCRLALQEGYATGRYKIIRLSRDHLENGVLCPKYRVLYRRKPFVENFFFFSKESELDSRPGLRDLI